MYPTEEQEGKITTAIAGGVITGVKCVEIDPDTIILWSGSHNLYSSPSNASLTLEALLTDKEINGVYESPGVFSNRWNNLKPYLFEEGAIHTVEKDVQELRVKRYVLGTDKMLYPLNPMQEILVFGQFPEGINLPEDLSEYLPVEKENVFYPTWKGYLSQLTTTYTNGRYENKLEFQDIFYWYNLSRINIHPAMIGPWVTGANLEFWDKERNVNSVYTTIFAGKSLKQVLGFILGFSGVRGGTAPLLVGVKDFFLEIADKIEASETGWFSIEGGHLFEAVRDLFQKTMQLIPPAGQLIIPGGGPLPFARHYFQQGDVVWSCNNLRVDSQMLAKSFSDIIPYAMSVGGIDLWQHDFKTRLEILEEIKEKTSLEIFMDTTTEIIIKLPSWNEVPLAKEGSPLDFAVRNLITKDIISNENSEVPEEAMNFLILTGDQFSQEYQIQRPTPLGQYNRLNANSIRRYLVKAESATSSLTVKESQIVAYSKFLMEKLSIDTFQDSLTIVSRPGVRLGRTIVYPLGRMILVGYVVNINETWEPGSPPQTTLGLQAVRSTSSGELYDAFPYSDFVSVFTSTRYVPVEKGKTLEDYIKQYYTKPDNISVIDTVILSNKKNFKSEYQEFPNEVILAKDVRDLFKEEINKIILRLTDK